MFKIVCNYPKYRFVTDKNWIFFLSFVVIGPLVFFLSFVSLLMGKKPIFSTEFD